MASLRSRVLVSVLSAALVPAALVVACGGDEGSSSGMAPGSSDAGIDRARLPAPLHPDASCPVTIDTPELLPGTHVPEGTPITWSSNPPSSGPHYPIWANFQEFDQPVDLGYVVHALEHGAIVMFHKCATGDPGCDVIVDAFRKVRDAIPSDPRCDPGVRVRVVIVPDPLLDVPVAAAAWGWTYKAECADLPTLTDFAKAHYAQGTEDLCAPGKTTF
jgi:hypothetical protein